MKRKHLPVALVASGAVAVLAGVFLLWGAAAALVVLGAAAVATGLLMEV